MTTLIETLRSRRCNRKTRRAAANLIQRQLATMDATASILARALHEGTLKPVYREVCKCIEQLRGHHHDQEQVTREEFHQFLIDRIAAAAGLPAGAPFDPAHVLDQMRVVLAAQSQNARYLEWALSVLWDPGSKNARPVLTKSIGCDSCCESHSFPSGTSWMEALDTILAKDMAAATAGAIAA